MLACALSAERDDYITILYLGRYAVLRIHECFRIDTAIAAKALKENALTIKGKGGLVRTVPLTASMAEYLRGIQKRQQEEKAFLGAAYVDSGYVCVGPDGTPLTPNTVSMHFRRMIRKSGLPYIPRAASQRSHAAPQCRTGHPGYSGLAGPQRYFHHRQNQVVLTVISVSR